MTVIRVVFVGIVVFRIAFVAAMIDVCLVVQQCLLLLLLSLCFYIVMLLKKLGAEAFSKKGAIKWKSLVVQIKRCN